MNDLLDKFICKKVKCVKIPEGNENYIIGKIYEVKIDTKHNNDLYVPCEKRFDGDVEFGINLTYALDCFIPVEHIEKKSITNDEFDNYIYKEMKEFYGERYYEYSYNCVTHEEFKKLKNLILKCIEKSTQFESKERKDLNYDKNLENKKFHF